MKIKGTHPIKMNIVERILAMSDSIEATAELLKDQGLDAGRKKAAFEEKKANALRYYKGSSKNQSMREAELDDQFAQERLDYYVANELKDSSVEYCRTMKQVLSALQTVVNGEKVIAELYSFGKN